MWRRSYVSVSPSVVNSLINDVFIEERQKTTTRESGANGSYRKEKYTLKWTVAKDIKLIFVVRVPGECDSKTCY